MASQTKTYNCKYCEITDLSRKEYIKHTKTKSHKISMKTQTSRTHVHICKLNEHLINTGNYKCPLRKAVQRAGLQNIKTLLEMEKMEK